MNSYTQEKQTELFNELGVFFAFGTKQYEDQKQEGIEYCTVLGAGDCVPTENAKVFAERLSLIHKEGREKELAEKGIDKIIEEELVNQECFYTGEIQDTVDALEHYQVSFDQVQSIYRKVQSKYDH